MELLIATPVNPLGMVVGKLFSALAYVFLLILASIPLMSLVFGFGGIAPDDVVRAYVMLFALAFGTGTIGLFMSALLKRTQNATAIAYVIVFVLTGVTFLVHSYLLASSTRWDGGRPTQHAPPEMILWLNPIVAGVDLICTAIPESGDTTCAYILLVTGQDPDLMFGGVRPAVPAEPGLVAADPPRDAFWPRSALAYIVLGIGLTLATTWLVTPRHRRRRQPPLGAPLAEGGPPTEAGPPTETEAESPSSAAGS